MKNAPPLPPGFLVEIALSAGLEVRGAGDKRTLRCPRHDDRRASSFISVSRNLHHCSVCGSLSAKGFCEALGIPWPNRSSIESGAQYESPGSTEPEPTFTPSDAQEVWRQAAARARDDRRVEADHEVYQYLSARNLGESWDRMAYGILSVDMAGELPPAVAWWPESGYRLVAPLYSVSSGELTNVQARNTSANPPRGRKVLFPRGGRATGTVFANDSGRRVLLGEKNDRAVVLAEGLSDYLAAVIVWGGPVVSTPGTSMAPTAIGPWVKGRTIILLLDADEPGKGAAGQVCYEVQRHGGQTIPILWTAAGVGDLCDAIDVFGEQKVTDFLIGHERGCHAS